MRCVSALFRSAGRASSTAYMPNAAAPVTPPVIVGPAGWPELLTEPDAPDVAPRTDEEWRLDRLMAEQEGRTWSA